MTSSKHNIYLTVGYNIQKYRLLKGWKQRELATKSILTDNFISKLESKTIQKISLDTLELIARALEIPIENFFDESVWIDKQKNKE